MNLYVDIEDINVLFKTYDGNSDGKLNYSEFCSIFFPSSSDNYIEIESGT